MRSFHSPSRTARPGQLSPRLALRHSQKIGLARATGSPRKAGNMFWPSGSYPAGSFTPATSQRVGNRSTAVSTVVLSTLPAGTFPGQRTMNGTPTPPSCRERLRPFNPAVLPTE